MDLNHRPRPYQGRALTGLSYGPMREWEIIARCSVSEGEFDGRT